MDIFEIYFNQGADKLKADLSTLSLNDIKAICKNNGLDATGSYRRIKNQSDLAEFVLKRVDAMVHKGKVFLR